jgi:exodeoxyribonuclease I
MGASFYFYDVETSGFRPREARIMQFAGQRTDENLNPVGKPDNFLIKMTPDVLPDPFAVLVHGITPQKTLKDGISEAEFLDYFAKKLCTAGTVFVGYNNIRFDDEFMRFMLWRNFHDAYEWHWNNSCSRWDLLDVVRMTRALRPKGLNWPYASDGKPTNRLADIAKVNKLKHDSAHDALSDVLVSIDVARLLKTNQPKLFDYLLNLRDKNKVAALVEKGDPLVYTSGRYPSEYDKTTIAVMVAKHPHKQAALMYDLREDPAAWTKLSAEELAAAWRKWGDDAPYFPVKILSYNRCPAIAPLSVLSTSRNARLRLDPSPAQNLPKLIAAKDFGDKLIKAAKLIQPKAQATLIVNEQEVDGLLYDGFVSNQDKSQVEKVRRAKGDELSKLKVDFSDERLKLLLPLYKARNYPESLDPLEQKKWQDFRAQKLLIGKDTSLAARFLSNIDRAATSPGLSEKGRQLLEELKLYGQSVIPIG